MGYLEIADSCFKAFLSEDNLHDFRNWKLNSNIFSSLRETIYTFCTYPSFLYVCSYFD